MIAESYATYCRDRGEDPHYLRLEERRWSAAPPRLIYRDEEHPSRNPYLWQREKGAYAASPGPGPTVFFRTGGPSAGRPGSE
jgi:hypothetical protein